MFKVEIGSWRSDFDNSEHAKSKYQLSRTNEPLGEPEFLPSTCDLGGWSNQGKRGGSLACSLSLSPSRFTQRELKKSIRHRGGKTGTGWGRGVRFLCLLQRAGVAEMKEVVNAVRVNPHKLVRHIVIAGRRRGWQGLVSDGRRKWGRWRWAFWRRWHWR